MDWVDDILRQLDEDDSLDDSLDDEWEGSIPWDQVVTLPRGLTLKGKASGLAKDVVEQELMQQLGATFSNGISKYYLTYADRWYVHHQCPCGHTSCETCIIPSTAVYRGTMHDGHNLEDMFLQEDPMPIAQAKTWWEQRTKRSVRITSRDAAGTSTISAPMESIGAQRF